MLVMDKDLKDTWARSKKYPRTWKLGLFPPEIQPPPLRAYGAFRFPVNGNRRTRDGTYQSPECFKPFFYNLGGSNTKGACEFGSYFLENNKTKYQKNKKQNCWKLLRLSLRSYSGLEHPLCSMDWPPMV